LASTSSQEFNQRLSEFVKVLRAAKRNKVSLTSHSFYSRKVRASLADLRKSFLVLQRDYPIERFPKVAFQLATIEPLLQELITKYPASPTEMLKLADGISFKVQSDLAAELDAPESIPNLTSSIPFIPDDLIEPRYYIPKKVLWEINRCYEAACYNSCAAMIRRLVENLIILAFEHHELSDKIRKDGDYLDFSDLIGKAIAEPKLALTRNTKKILPDLKFFGDLGSHNRNALVRKNDLDKLHQATRSAIEELVRNI
jgi:hypothetical protein